MCLTLPALALATGCVTTRRVTVLSAGMGDSYFTTPDGEWFQPTDFCRGPWDPDACHAGPPTGILARASELAVPHQPLARITVDLIRPVPQAGFRVASEVVRSGKTVSTTLMRVFAADGKEVITARGLHQAAGGEGELDDVPTTPYVPPPLAEAVDGPFPVGRAAHDLPFFRQSVRVRYNPGERTEAGPKRVWMAALPLLPDEEPSPFQRICPLADCANAFGRTTDDLGYAYMNTDLTVLLHRPPQGEWLGMDVLGRWEPTGVGMSDAVLFDELGAVGKSLQTLLLRRR